jgi:hypothetical protein
MNQYLRATLSGMHEGLRLRLIMSGPKWCGLPRNPGAMSLAPVLKSPWVVRRVRNEQTGGKILSVHDWGGGLVRFVLESNFFR